MCISLILLLQLFFSEISSFGISHAYIETLSYISCRTSKRIAA